MTVARASNVWTFAGTGSSAGPFGIETPVYDVSHLSVGLVTTATGAFVPLTYGTGWTVSGIGAETGVTITLTAAHAVGTTLLIRIRPPLTQLVDIANLGRFNPSDVERAFDLVVQTLQQFQTDLNRAIKVPEGETGFAATLAAINVRASKVLGFTPSGGLDYPANGAGSGSFINLPTALAFPADGKVLFQTAAGAGGGTTFYADANDIKNAPLETVTYPTSTTLSTGDSGKVIKSTGQTTNIVYTLPAGASGLFYVIHRDSDAFTVAVDPNGSEQIASAVAGTPVTLLTRGWLVLQWEGGRWEITEAYGVDDLELGRLSPLLAPLLGTQLTAAQGVYDVTAEGAVPDNSTACLTAFQNTAAKVTTRAGTILVPAATTAASVPLYRLSNGRFLVDNLGTNAATVPGGSIDLRYRLGLESGPLILPHGHKIVGTGAHTPNTNTPVGSEIWALAGMTRRLEVTQVERTGGTTVTVTASNHDVRVGETVTFAGWTTLTGAFVVASVPTGGTFTVASAGSNVVEAFASGKTITTTARPRVVQLLPTANTAGGDSTRLERVTVNGRDVTGCIGVWSDSIQESSGLFDFVVRGCATGVDIVAAVGITPANFSIERGHIILSSVAGNQGDGLRVYGGKGQITKVTAVNTGTTTGQSGFVLRGSEHLSKNLHFEGFDYGCTIGGPDTGYGNDTGVWDYLLTVDNLHGFNQNTQPGLIAAARIRNDSTSVFGVNLTDIGINTHNKGPAWAAATAYALGDRRSISTSSAVQLECTTAGTSHASTEPVAGVVGATVSDGTVTWTYRHLCALVLDEVNGINIPSLSSANHRQLQYYRFAGTMGDDAGSAVKRPVFTSYYDGLCPGGAVKALASANALDRTFTGGALASILQINGNTTIQTLGNAYPGAVVYLDIQSGGPTIDHQSVSGTATERIITSTGADITGASGFYRLTYGDARGAADRWYCEPA